MLAPTTPTFAKISPAAAVQVNGFALAFQCVM